jgi:hypothetical protein
MGIQPIATVGETFDPHFHEAVATEESNEFDPNTVSAELLRGYRIGNRVIRHSMVKVATSPQDAEAGTGGSDTDDGGETPIEETPIEETTAEETAIEGTTEIESTDEP